MVGPVVVLEFVSFYKIAITNEWFMVRLEYGVPFEAFRCASGARKMI